MTGRPTDDELREMLESRASRVSPDTDREAMAGLRAAMRGTPDARGGFAVLPVAISGRGARLPGSIVAVGLVAVILVAVARWPADGAEGGLERGGRRHPRPREHPDAGRLGARQRRRPARGRCRRSGRGPTSRRPSPTRSIVGQVVVVDGPLTTRLCNPGGSCVVDIDGLDGRAGRLPAPAAGARTLVGPGSQTALRVRDDGGLDYLGQLDADAQRAADRRRPRPRGLDARSRAVRRRLALRSERRTWKATRSASCRSRAIGRTTSGRARSSPASSPAHRYRHPTWPSMAVTLSDDFDHDSRRLDRRVDVPRQLLGRRLAGRRDRGRDHRGVGSAIAIAIAVVDVARHR